MPASPARGIYCNRTLNLRSIRAIGYDMDYTLIHYHVVEWERHAYRHVKQKLLQRGWPVEELTFDPERVIRGLIIDTEMGNTLKVNRFGYVKGAFHGTTRLSFDEQRRIYARTVVDLSEERYVFLNTLFSISEGSLYAQLVDRLDGGALGERMGYHDLYRVVRASISDAHVEGELKAEIVSDPERFVDLDDDLPRALLDQRDAGKKLLLITNSEWPYTRAMMHYAFDPFLPGDMTWRELFDIVIVSARKPAFFTTPSPLFRVVSEEGLLQPCAKGLEGDGTYLGGHAAYIEEHLGVSGDEILYVGDHIFTDVNVSKSILRWRTALVLRELESDLAAIDQFSAQQSELTRFMARKEQLEAEICQLRLTAQRYRAGRTPDDRRQRRRLDGRVKEARVEVDRLDQQLSPLAAAANALGNRYWGPLMRAGNDKSHLARQVERYADVYLSRVSNFLYETPFRYFRAARGSLPHDPDDVPIPLLDEGEG